MAKHGIKILVLDNEMPRHKKILLKKTLMTQEEAVEAFRVILQANWGLPDDKLIERFKKAIDIDG